MSEAGERFLTIRQVAEIFSLNPRTIREYIRRGQLAGRLIGRRWRFRRSDLDAFFENSPRWWTKTGKSGEGE